MTEKLAELTLAALLALTAHFKAGLESFQAGRHEQAVDELSQVIAAEPGVAGMAEQARLYRAQALQKLNKEPAAFEDLKALLLSTGDNALRRQGAQVYRDMKFDPNRLMPELSPKQTFEALMGAVGQKDEPKVLGYFGGPLMAILNTMQRIMSAEGRGMGRGGGDDSMLLMMLSELAQGRVVEEKTHPFDARATMVFTHQGATMTLGLIPAGKHWTFNDILDFQIQRQQPNMGMMEAMPPPDAVRSPDPADEAIASFEPKVAMEDVPAARREEILGLIRQLGAQDFKIRSKARAQLKEIGDEAGALLKEHLNDPDPEIALSVKELLRALAAPKAP